jgi:hypothetical protein
LIDQSPTIDLTRPRTISQIVSAALRLYARWPLLFMALAGIVAVPYSVANVLVSNSRHVSSSTLLILYLANAALVTPMIVALQMQAIVDLGAGRRPALRDVIARGLRVVPVVAAAEIIAALVAFAGLLFFVIPGLIAAVRLAVVAPVAATEGVAWPDAIKRSLRLTQGNAWRVLGLILIEDLINYLGAVILQSASSAAVVAGVLIELVAQSFCILLISLLYFDLRARETALVASP